MEWLFSYYSVEQIKLEPPPSQNDVCLPFKSARSTIISKTKWHLGLGPDMEDMTGTCQVWQ